MYGQYGGDLQHDVLDDDGLGGEGEGADGGCLDRGPQEANCPTPHQLITGPPTTAETFAGDFNFPHQKYEGKEFRTALVPFMVPNSS